MQTGQHSEKTSAIMTTTDDELASIEETLEQVTRHDVAVISLPGQVAGKPIQGTSPNNDGVRPATQVFTQQPQQQQSPQQSDKRLEQRRVLRNTVSKASSRLMGPTPPARPRARTEFNTSVTKAKTLIELAKHNPTSSAFKNQLSNVVTFERVHMLTGDSTFEVKQEMVPNAYPTLAAEDQIIDFSQNMIPMTAQKPLNDMNLLHEKSLASMTVRLLAKSNSRRVQNVSKPKLARRLTKSSDVRYSMMALYIAPLLFAHEHEPHQLLSACVAMCESHGDDATIFGAEVPRALEAGAWSSATVHKIFTRFRLLNAMWVILFFVSRVCCVKSSTSNMLWTVVGLDCATALTAIGFLCYARRHGMVHVSAIVIGIKCMECMLGKRIGVGGTIHYGINVWNAICLLLTLMFLLPYDISVAQRPFNAPIESASMESKRIWLVFAKVVSIGATFVSAMNLLFGAEAVRSARGSRFVIALSRGVSEVFGLFPFIAPMFFMVSMLMHIATWQVDPIILNALGLEVHRKQYELYSFSIFAGADYLFGAPRSAGAFASVPNAWWLLSFVHIFALVAGSILVVNLLIGIVSDAWEQSVGDSLYWRRFGRAAFAVAIYKAKLNRAGVVQHERTESNSANEDEDQSCCGKTSFDKVQQQPQDWPAQLAWVKPEFALGLGDRGTEGGWVGRIETIASRMSQVQADVQKIEQSVTTKLSRIEEKLDRLLT